MTYRSVAQIVMEKDLPGMVAAGASVTVTCAEIPIRRTAGWHGRWTVTVQSADGESLHLVTTCDPSEARVFKTLTGIVSHLVGLGFEPIAIPMAEGGTALNRFDVPDA